MFDLERTDEDVIIEQDHGTISEGHRDSPLKEELWD